MNTPPVIMLADDNPDDQVFIRDAFTYLKAKVNLQILDSGIDLLHHLKVLQTTELPSLIVLDYNMPELNGAEVLTRLLNEERYKDIPKLILSTSMYKQHIDHCIKLGADGYLTKPDNFFDWEKLAQKMLTFCKIGDSQA